MKLKYIFNGEFYFNICLHVTILFTILSIFFCKYIRYITTSAINSELSNNINTLFKNNILTKYGNYIPDNYLNYYVSLFSKDDYNRELINTNIINNITFTTILIYFILVFITLILISTNQLTFKHILDVFIENIITFIFVGIIEIIFFLKIAFKYIPAPPSLIVTSLINNIKLNFSKI